MITRTIVLHMAMSIAPNAEHTYNANTIITTIANSANTKHEAAKLLVMAWHESRFKEDAVGDKGKALGPWQLHRTTREVLTNMPLAAHITMKRLRYSEEICPTHPLAVFARGNCHDKDGIAISDSRMKEVERIEQIVE